MQIVYYTLPNSLLAINTKFVITSQDLKNTNKYFQELDLIHKEKIRVLILLLGFWLVGWLVDLNIESHNIVLESLELAMLTRLASKLG